MSGVLTVLVAGVVMAHFNFYNLSMTGQVATGYFFYKVELLINQSPLLHKQLCLFIWVSLSCIMSQLTPFHSVSLESNFLFVSFQDLQQYLYLDML